MRAEYGARSRGDGEETGAAEERGEAERQVNADKHVHTRAHTGRRWRREGRAVVQGGEKERERERAENKKKALRGEMIPRGKKYKREKIGFLTPAALV